MAFLNRIVFIVLSLTLFTSCYSDFEPDIESDPIVCINALAKTGEPLCIYVTRTWRWSEGDPDIDIDIVLKDAIVSLYVNGELVETPQFSVWEANDPTRPWINEEKGYKCTYTPSPGDLIRITAHSLKYGDAEGEVRVPMPVDIDNTDINIMNVKANQIGDKFLYTGDALLELWFTDPAEMDNYYMFGHKCNYDYGDNMISNAYIEYDSEPLFTEHVSPIESIISETSGYTIFTDRLIAGKSYPLHIRVSNIQYEVASKDNFDANKSKILLTLNAISESYYKHVLSVWVSNDGISGILGDIGLGDPTWECSNVSTGAGVIAAIASSTVEIPLSMFFKDK